jgi:hypothetical protein
MNMLHKAYHVPADCDEALHILLFRVNSPSHESWANFVDQGPGGLPAIIALLHDEYQAQLKVGADYWWIEFPDVETRVSFELTWM